MSERIGKTPETNPQSAKMIMYAVTRIFISGQYRAFVAPELSSEPLALVGVANDTVWDPLLLLLVLLLLLLLLVPLMLLAMAILALLVVLIMPLDAVAVVPHRPVTLGTASLPDPIATI